MKSAGHKNDTSFARWMIDAVGVATVPGSSFFRSKEHELTKIRFCFCKRPETLSLAADLLREGFKRPAKIRASG